MVTEFWSGGVLGSVECGVETVGGAGSGLGLAGRVQSVRDRHTHVLAAGGKIFKCGGRDVGECVLD